MELVKRGFVSAVDTLPMLYHLTLADCVRECLRTVGCQSFSYRRTGSGRGGQYGSCVIISPYGTPSVLSVENEQEWDYYSVFLPTFTVVELDHPDYDYYFYAYYD